MKIGDIVRVGGKHAALVIAVVHRDGDGRALDLGAELRVRFLKEPKTRWVLVASAEVLSENR